MDGYTDDKGIFHPFNNNSKKIHRSDINSNTTVMLQEPIEEKSLKVSKNSEFKPKSKLLKKVFGNQIPVSPNVTSHNLRTGKEQPVPLIVETNYLDTLIQSFLTDDGYFINAGQVTNEGFRITHATILSYLTGESISDLNTDQTAKLAGDLHLVRVADAYGEVIIHVPSKLSSTQVRKINQLIKNANDEEKTIEFDVGSDDLSTRFSTDDRKEFYEELHKRNFI